MSCCQTGWGWKVAGMEFLPVASCSSLLDQCLASSLPKPGLQACMYLATSHLYTPYHTPHLSRLIVCYTLSVCITGCWSW